MSVTMPAHLVTADETVVQRLVLPVADDGARLPLYIETGLSAESRYGSESNTGDGARSDAGVVRHLLQRLPRVVLAAVDRGD